MDVNGLALAWLTAVRRTQSPAPVIQLPAAERNLTDVIERALRDGGPDSRDPGWVDPMQAGGAVDRTV